MNGRRGKQCRDRWLNHLKPDIRRGEWTAEEERILVEGHRMLGTRWAALAKLLPGRPENAIKNHWHATLRCKWAQRGGKISELQAYQHSLQLTNGAGGGAAIGVGQPGAAGAKPPNPMAGVLGGVPGQGQSAVSAAAAVAAAAAAAAAVQKHGKGAGAPFDFDGAATAAAVAAAAAAVVGRGTGGAGGNAEANTQAIARALDSLVQGNANAAKNAAKNAAAAARAEALATATAARDAAAAAAAKTERAEAAVATARATTPPSNDLASLASDCATLSGDAALAAAGLAVTGAAADVIEATERPLGAFYTLVPIRPRRRGERRSLRTFAGVSLRPPLAFNPRPRRLSTPLLTPFNSTPDLNRYVASVRSAGASCAEVVTLTSSHYLKKGSGGFPLLGEHLAAHATLVESALRRIAGTIRKRYNSIGKVALAIRLGNRVKEGDLALVIAVSAPRWRDAVDAAHHASSDVKDKLIASIAPQCLGKEPKAAAALAVVAAAAGTSVEEILKRDDSDDEGDEDNSPVPIGAAAAALGGITRVPSNFSGDDGADVDQPGEGEGEGEEEVAGDGDDDDDDADADADADAGGAPRNESPAPTTPEEMANA